LEDTSAFPNLVVKKTRNAQSRGAWTSGPTIVTAASTLTPATLAANQQGLAQPTVVVSPSSPALIDIMNQLAENREYRKKFEASRAIDKEEFRSFRETLNTIYSTIEQDRIASQHQHDQSTLALEQDRIASQQQHAQTTLVLEQVTDGHTDLQLTIETLDAQRSVELKELRNDISKLSATLLSLVQHRDPLPLSTPPRIQWTDSVGPVSLSGHSLALAKKRSPDRTPDTPNHGFTKTSRLSEGMDTDASKSARQP
jgi:hypothetical protein